MKIAFGAVLFGATMLALPVQADVVHGVWQTQPDDKGQIGHVRISDCGAALCGTIVRAYDKTGNEITTKNVGKQIVSKMTPTAGGAYEGRVLVPKFNRSLNGKMEVKGKRLKISGCLLGICNSRTWIRVN